MFQLSGYTVLLVATRNVMRVGGYEADVHTSLCIVISQIAIPPKLSDDDCRRTARHLQVVRRDLPPMDCRRASAPDASEPSMSAVAGRLAAAAMQ